MKAFSAPRGERDPLLTLVVNASSSSTIREEKSALESFRKKRESSVRNKEKFTKKEEEDQEVQRPKNNNNKTIHDVFAHSAVFILVLFSAFFAFVCVGFVHRSHYIRAKENALVRAMNADMLEETLMKNTNELVPLSVFLKTSGSGSDSLEEEEDENGDEDGRRKDALFAAEKSGKRRKKEEKVETTKYSNGKSFARTILTKEEVKPFEKWLAKDGEIELDKLVEALRADKETLYEKNQEEEGTLGRREKEDDEDSSSSSSTRSRNNNKNSNNNKWKHSSATFAASINGGGGDDLVDDSTVPNSKHKFSLCLDDMENWDVRLGAGAWMDALIQTKPEGKNSAGECFTNVVYDSGPECAKADVRVFQSGSVLLKGAYVSRENPAPPQEGTTIGAKLMAKLGFFDNDILGPDINQDIMIDSSLENENRTAQDPIEFTEEAIYEDQMAFWESKSNRRMLLNNKKSKKKKSSGEKEEVVLHQRGEKQEEKKNNNNNLNNNNKRRCGDFRRSKIRIKCTCTPRWKHPARSERI